MSFSALEYDNVNYTKFAWGIWDEKQELALALLGERTAINVLIHQLQCLTTFLPLLRGW